jgi:Skp family chaperone for outer membrane proteins
MRITTALPLTVALAWLGLGVIPAAAQGRIGTVDLKRAFEGYWKTKQADASLKERAADLDKARKGMVDDYQKANEEYKKLLDGVNDQAVSSEERERRRKTAEAKLLELKEIENSIAQFDRQSRTTLGEQQRRMRDNILREIQDVVNTKARAKSLSLVVDTAAESVNQTPIILFTSRDNDLTEEVLEQLNAAAPKTTEPPDEKKAK